MMNSKGGNKNLLRQAQEMQQRLSRVQEELEQATIEATAGGGAVRVVMTGKMHVQSIEIAREAVDPTDVDMLQDLIQAAMNEVLDKTQRFAQGRLASVTGGLNIPGLM